MKRNALSRAENGGCTGRVKAFLEERKPEYREK